MTRSEAIERLRIELRAASYGKGTTCPLCNRHSQIYKRWIRYEMSLWLYELVRIYFKTETRYLNGLMS